MCQNFLMVSLTVDWTSQMYTVCLHQSHVCKNMCMNVCFCAPSWLEWEVWVSLINPDSVFHFLRCYCAYLLQEQADFYCALHIFRAMLEEITISSNWQRKEHTRKVVFKKCTVLNLRDTRVCILQELLQFARSTLQGTNTGSMQASRLLSGVLNLPPLFMTLISNE